MSCSGTANCACGCCAGTSVQTPSPVTNPPGQSSITYRTGDWAAFKASMLARLSSADYPALAGLRTRDDDDFTIAFLDATAMVLDVLTFYQERLANESYLRTATQPRSLTELSRLIGYAPAPGTGAAAYLAFTVQAAPGQAPNPATPPITIPKGTGVQSVPAQNQTPQTFETAADVAAKPDWNALAVQTGQPWAPRTGDTQVYLDGIATQLQPGDLFVIVGDERVESTSNENWDVRVVRTAVADPQNQRTRVTWDEGLGSPAFGVTPTRAHPKFFAFRQRAALFGYNAINPMLLDTTNTKVGGLLNQNGTEWAGFALTATIDLDSIYSRIVPEGWVALIQPDRQSSRSPSGIVSLYQVSAISPVSRSDYGLSAKISRVTPDLTSNLGTFSLRETIVLAQSDELAVAEQPLDYPLHGTVVDLKGTRPDLVGVQVVAISGRRQKLAVADGVTGLAFQPSDGTDPMTLNPGDTLTAIALTPPPADPDGSLPAWSTSTASQTLTVEDARGRPGQIQAALSNFTLAPSAKSDPLVSETALVASVSNVASPEPHLRIVLAAPLGSYYDRAGTTINANVGFATQGQSVTEILGSGRASTPNQDFPLKQKPLTYVQAPTVSGRQSTLQVRVNGVAWTEAATLYQQPPAQPVFTTLNQADGSTDVQFGDGVEGATLPTGTNNVQASYRVGLGAAGNVGAGALTTLLDRPLGVNGVTNPEAATGGQDPESPDAVRTNAPQTVLTLGRAVSIADYASFASTFSGIAKANAVWIPSGPARGVFLTVAGVGGADLTGTPTLANLITALHTYGNSLVPITARSFLESLFGFAADLAYDPAYDRPTVQAAVLQTLDQEYGFSARTFGQGVSADELAATIQGVPGVVAVNVTRLTRGATSARGDLAGVAGGFSLASYNAWLTGQISRSARVSDPPFQISPNLPVASPTGMPRPAEILVLDPNPAAVVLGVMS